MRNKIQKAAPSIKGTLNMSSIVFTGDTPKAMRAAYEVAPIMPAPPVPDDHVDITFLKISEGKTYSFRARSRLLWVNLLVKF